MRGRLTGGDRNDHNDAEYDDHYKIDGQHQCKYQNDYMVIIIQ